uniref:Alkylated DNA repair dioxygenase n=1 Tax=Marseillevirus LCMAC101 TaxID=2506602 RepID=A0A481YRN5_9VIRU|nr:MAG: alkylated DNA repair dioxygenase [Marseillevirus LCMAC101]
MKYNDKGIACGLDDMEVVKQVFTNSDVRDYFDRLKKELPWQELTWANEESQPKLVFRYGELERNIRKYNVLEELIFLLEEVFEADILGCWGDYYRNGKDNSPYKRHNYNSHIFTVSFGEHRKLTVKDEDEEETTFRLKNGEVLYVSYDTNKSLEYSVPPSKRNTGKSIYLTFYAEKPYSRRHQHIRHINVLGVGRIQVWFEGNCSEFPEDAVATILPSSLRSMISGPHLTGGRLEFGSPSLIETFLIREHLEGGDEESE